MGLSEKLLNICGHEIWPPTHGDPRIKGPQPRIITERQKDWLEKLQRENPGDGVDTVVRDVSQTKGGSNGK